MTILPGAFPDNISPEVKALLEEYMHLSNCASTHNDHTADERNFAQLFTADAIYDFMGMKSAGHEAIISFREKIFSEQPHRDHPMVKIYTFGSDDLNLMALGQVEYQNPDGTKMTKVWAGTYKIVKIDGALKFKHIRVIADVENV